MPADSYMSRPRGGLPCPVPGPPRAAACLLGTGPGPRRLHRRCQGDSSAPFLMRFTKAKSRASPRRLTNTRLTIQATLTPFSASHADAAWETGGPTPTSTLLWVGPGGGFISLPSYSLEPHGSCPARGATRLGPFQRHPGGQRLGRERTTCKHGDALLSSLGAARREKRNQEA